MDDLRKALREERLASYARLRGGYSVSLAGAAYWAVLAGAGYVVSAELWRWIALFGSGAIFPLALLFSKLLKNDFMNDRSPVGSLLAPAFIGMLLFWPMAIAAVWYAEDLFPLILAVGLSIHWPVIGWTYGRTSIYSAHAIVRALVVFFIWLQMPDARLTLLPLSVSAIYIVTVLVILIDSARVRSARAGASS